MADIFGDKNRNWGKMRENFSCFFPITAVTHKTLRAKEIELAVWRMSLPADVPVDL